MKVLQNSLCFLMLCGFFFLMPAYAEENEVGKNSALNSRNHLILYKGDIYCLANPHNSVFTLSTIYRITSGQSENICCAVGIEEIYAHTDGIVLVRKLETMESILAHMLSSNIPQDMSVELWDTDTLSSVEWLRYSTDSQTMLDVFTVDGNLFTWEIGNEGSYLLEKYEAPYVSLTMLQRSSKPVQYPSFSLTALTPTFLKKNKAYVSIYDIVQNQQYEALNAISLPYSYDTQGALQAVLQDDDLFYLSKDSLCKYSFAENTNKVILSYDIAAASYHSFTLTCKYAICYSGDYKIHVYDLETGQCIKKLSSSVATINHLYYDDVLYLYSPYDPNAVEMIDFDRFVQTRYELNN